MKRGLVGYPFPCVQVDLMDSMKVLYVDMDVDVGVDIDSRREVALALPY